MTTTTALLTPADVERLELSARADLISAVGTIAQLRDGSAHLAAGFPTWGEYLLARFGDLLAELRDLEVADRRAVVLQLRLGDGERGMSQRAIAARLRVGLGTVSEDIKALREAGLLDGEPTKVVSGDGRDRPARGVSQPDAPATAATAPLPAPTGRVYLQAAEWLRRADAGLIPGHVGAGLTLVELAAVARWTEGKASGALSYLTAPARGLAIRLEEERDEQRVHVLAGAGRALLAAIAEATVPAAASAVGEGYLQLEVG